MILKNVIVTLLKSLLRNFQVGNVVLQNTKLNLEKHFFLIWPKISVLTSKYQLLNTGKGYLHTFINWFVCVWVSG